jgi:putative DNA primase/helicase
MKQNKDSRQASGDIARLNGCRFLNASEPPKRMIFDVALLKTLLGRDTITARHLHEREFEFVPIFKLVINTNFLPLITDDYMFSSGRINVITFDRHFEPHEQDRILKTRLREPENISGLFNWCLVGLRLFK